LEDNRKPSYWAVIPATVRYDPQLKPNAKLLYAEITALQEASGYCWASNKYLADLFGLKSETITALVGDLAKAGYVEVEVVRDAETREVLQRRIWTTGRLPTIATPSPINIGEGSPINIGEPPRKISGENNKSINNIPPKAPQGGQRRKRRDDWKETAEHRPERFEKFWEFYPRGEKRQAAIRAWDRLSPSDEVIDQMAKALKRQILSEDWKNGIGIPYASTWINQRRWTDEIRVTAKESAAEQAYDPRGGLTAW